jgi:hypothetical protein
LDGAAANRAILDVVLSRNGWIDENGDRLAAKRTLNLGFFLEIDHSADCITVTCAIGRTALLLTAGREEMRNLLLAVTAVASLAAVSASAVDDRAKHYLQQKAAFCAGLVQDTPGAIRQFRREILQPGLQIVEIETEPTGSRLGFAGTHRQLPHPPGVDLFPVRYFLPGFLVSSEAVAFLQPYAEWLDDFEDTLKASLWTHRIPFRRITRGKITFDGKERFVVVMSLEEYLKHQSTIVDAIDLFHFFLTGSD